MAITLDRKTLEYNFPRSAATGQVSVETAPGSDGSMRISVRVSDLALRDALKASAGQSLADKFDGMEHPVALVPTSNGFARYPLSFVGTTPASGMSPDVDHYQVLIGKSGYDLTAAITRGVALLLETSAGDVWLQAENDNYPAIPK